MLNLIKYNILKLHRLINNELFKNKWNKFGYIIINFPETIEQAQNLFNLEKFMSTNKNNTDSFETENYPSINLLLLI